MNYFIEKAIYDILRITSLTEVERIQVFHTITKYQKLIFVIFCLKILYDQYTKFVDFEKKMLEGMELLKQRTIYDSPKFRNKIKVHLVSIIKNSFHKIYPKKLKEEDALPAEPHHHNSTTMEVEEEDFPSEVRRTLKFE